MRNFLRRYVAAAGLVTALVVTASAVPAQAAVPVVVASRGTLRAGSATCSNPVPPPGAIGNSAEIYSVNVGAIHLRDCNYTRGNYDALLPFEDNTSVALNWREAAGIFIGAGYCTQVWDTSYGQADRYSGSDPRGPVQIFFPEGGNSQVRPYRC